MVFVIQHDVAGVDVVVGDAQRVEMLHSGDDGCKTRGLVEGFVVFALLALNSFLEINRVALDEQGEDPASD